MTIFAREDEDLDALDGAAPPMPQPKNPCVFPAVLVDGRGAGGLTLEVGGGLKLRDYFAAAIAGGLMAGESAAAGQTPFTARRLAERVYQLADAMIAVGRGEGKEVGDAG